MHAYPQMPTMQEANFNKLKQMTDKQVSVNVSLRDTHVDRMDKQYNNFKTNKEYSIYILKSKKPSTLIVESHHQYPLALLNWKH